MTSSDAQPQHSTSHGPEHFAALEHLPGAETIPGLPSPHLQALKDRGRAIRIAAPTKDQLQHGDIVLYSPDHGQTWIGAQVSRAYVRAIRVNWHGGTWSKLNVDSSALYRLDPAPCLASKAWSPSHGTGALYIGPHVDDVSAMVEALAADPLATSADWSHLAHLIKGPMIVVMFTDHGKSQHTRLRLANVIRECKLRAATWTNPGDVQVRADDPSEPVQVPSSELSSSWELETAAADALPDIAPDPADPGYDLWLERQKSADSCIPSSSWERDRRTLVRAERQVASTVDYGRSIGANASDVPLKARTRSNLAGLAKMHAQSQGQPLGLSYGSGDTGLEHGPDRPPVPVVPHVSVQPMAIGDRVSGLEHVGGRPVAGTVELFVSAGLYVRTADGQSVYLDGADGWVRETDDRTAHDLSDVLDAFYLEGPTLDTNTLCDTVERWGLPWTADRGMAALYTLAAIGIVRLEPQNGPDVRTWSLVIDHPCCVNASAPITPDMAGQVATVGRARELAAQEPVQDVSGTEAEADLCHDCATRPQEPGSDYCEACQRYVSPYPADPAMPASADDLDGWHAYVRAARNLAVAQDRMQEAVAAGVDFAALNARTATG